MNNMNYVEAKELAKKLNLKRVSKKAAKKIGLWIGKRLWNNGDWFYEVAEIEN